MNASDEIEMARIRRMEKEADRLEASLLPTPRKKKKPTQRDMEREIEILKTNMPILKRITMLLKAARNAQKEMFRQKMEHLKTLPKNEQDLIRGQMRASNRGNVSFRFHQNKANETA